MPDYCFSTDDELGTATGYHNALPLEVHGSGYTQMHMISNTKAEKLVRTFFMMIVNRSWYHNECLWKLSKLQSRFW